jgi:RNA methyltransferase, TrmH family
MLTLAQRQALLDLRLKKHREARGLFVIEGTKVVTELLQAKFPFEAIYATSAWSGPRTHELSSGEMAGISHFPTPSPVLAVGRLRRTPLSSGALDRGLTLALDGVQDPGNVGTLLRIADWFGLDRVVLSPDCADLFSQKTINASMGSFARIAVHRADLPAALAEARSPVFGCDLAGESVHALPPCRDAVIVIGSEGRGLSEAIKRRIKHFITIPRYGGAQSLNAAVAAAIVCDNLRRIMP